MQTTGTLCFQGAVVNEALTVRIDHEFLVALREDRAVGFRLDAGGDIDIAKGRIPEGLTLDI